MAKRRRRYSKDMHRFYEQATFLAGNSDGSNDTKTQVDLDIGSDAYEDMLESRDKDTKVEEEQFHSKLEETNESLRQTQIGKHEITEAFRTGQRKYRRYMSKDVKTRQVKAVIENGLDKKISKHDFDDELYDDGISGDEFPKEAARDHKQEFEERREIPTVDTNKDGIVDDQDDVMMTPGMKKLSRYM